MKDNITAFNSEKYDEGIKQTLPYYEEFYRQVADAVHCLSERELTWLDVGCGTGKMAETAFREFRIKRFVFCDASQDMIKIAEKRFQQPGAGFLAVPVQDLMFSEEFDVVTAIQVNHYLNETERKEALQRCYEALKRDGILITFENFAPYSDMGKHLYLERWKRWQQSRGKSMSECQKHIDRYGKDYFPITLSKHLEIMKDCGFQTVEILWLSYMQAGFIGIK